MKETKTIRIWHDASEEPQDPQADILIEGDILNNKLFYACCTFDHPFLKWNLVKRWAYISDIRFLSNLVRTGENWRESWIQDLEEASRKWLEPQLDKYFECYGEGKMMELTKFDGYAMLEAVEFGANWKREQLIQQLSAEWEHLLDDCRKGKGGLVMHYQSELYKAMIARLKEM